MKLALILLLLIPTLLIAQHIRKEAYTHPDSVLELIAAMDTKALNLDQSLAKGIALLKTSRYDSSIVVLKSIKNRFNEMSHGESIELSYLLARCYYFKGDYSEAISNILEAVSGAEQIDSDKDIVFTKKFAGELYRASDNPYLARKYLEEALELAYQINDQLGIAYSLNRLGVLAYQDQNHEEADSLFQLSMPIAIELNDQNVISMNLNDMGEVYNNAKDFERSLALYQQALELPLSLDMKINTRINIARTYVSMGKFNEGIASAKEALNAANVAEILTLAVDAARVIADGYMFQGLHEEGIKYYRTYMNYRGKLFEEKKNAEILELETKYATEKNKLLVEAKDIEIKRQEASIRLFIIGSFILACLLFVIAYFYIRSRKLQRELSSLNQTKDKLFAIVSHDLRNALSSFEGIGSVIVKYVERKEYDKVEKIVGEFDKESHQIHELLDNLLNWSVTQLKETPYKPESVELNSLAKGVQALYEGIAKEKNINIILNVNNDHRVNADPNALSLIIRNLVGNAIKYSKEDSEIRITSICKADMVEVRIADTGIGFDREQLVKLSSPSAVETKSGTKGEKGTGLGLTLCLEYLYLHNSTLEVVPNKPSGTIFKFQLAVA
ncbi:tetratricopeptide repeat protein [Ekhidna sp.]|uniref:tetratricopeptide repeat protein n=1 Tax=Ekhidna sp. TaxID=2608089 RepID=UPI003CCB78E5